MFARIGWIEKIGSGFARMKNYCREVNVPIYKLDVDEKYFRIIFFKSRDYLELAEKGVEILSEKQQIIVALVKKNKNKKKSGKRIRRG